MDELSAAVEQVKKSRLYRGQIHKGVLLEARDPIPYDPNGFPDPRLKSAADIILKACGYSFLYSHQGTLIERLFEDKSVGLFIPRGAGRRTSLVLASAAYAVVKGKSVLILSRDDESAHKLAARFPASLSRIVSSHFLEHEHISAQLTTDIIISTPERLGRFLLRNYNEVKEWLSTLGLFAISDITHFDSVQLAHADALAELISCLVSGIEKIYYLVSGEPINNAAQVLTSISKSDDNAVVLSDGREKNAINLLYWIPPHIIDASSGKPKIERRGFYREIGFLLEMMKDRKNLLVWHSYAAVSKDRIARLLRTFSPAANPTIIDGLDDIEAAPKSAYDGLIMLGLPNNMEATLDSLGHFLVKGSPAVVVLPNDPATMHFVRSEGQALAKEYPELLLCETTPHIELLYFMLLLHLEDREILDKTNFIFLLKSHSEHIGQRLLADKILIDEDDYFGIDRIALIDKLEKRFHGTLREESVKVEFGRQDKYLDSCYFPERYFPGSLHIFKETVHQLVKDDQGYSFRSFGENAPVKRVPSIQYSSADAQPASSLSQSGISFQLFEGNLSAVWKGFNEYSDYSAVPRKPVLTTVGEGLSFERSTYLIKIEYGELSHNLLHLMKIWLPRYYLNFNDYFDLYSDERNVYLFSFFALKKEAYNFWGMIASINRKVLTDSLGLLLDDCPCRSGCPYCLEIADCGAEKESLDKPGTMRFVSGVLGKEAESRIVFKYSGLPSEEAQSFYEEIKNKIFILFEKKLDLSIKNKVPIVAVKTGILESPIIGLFNSRLVQVVELLSEAAATETIAHEYAHNWAAENMVIDDSSFPPECLRKELKDFLKKVIIEGFAEWVAFKVMDFHGLESNMADIHLRKYDEYGEGFHALYWLEDHYGFQAVIDFVKSGKVAVGEGKSWGLSEILNESGVKARIIR